MLPPGPRGPTLVTIGHDFTIHGTGALTRLASPRLARVGGSFAVEWMGALTSLGDHDEFAALAEIGGALTIRDDWALLGIDLPVLAAVGGPIVIARGELVRHVDLPALTEIPSATIEGGALERVDLGALARVDALSICGITSIHVPGRLVDLDLGALHDAGSLTLCGFGAVDALALPTLTTVTGELRLGMLGGLTAIRLAGLHRAGRISIDSGALAELELDPTAYVGDLTLAVLDLTAATAITLPASVSGTARFTRITAPDLRALRSLHAARRLMIDNNPDLVDLRGLDPAIAIDGLDVSSNPALTSLRGLDGLTALRDDLSITYNPRLASLDLPALTSVGAAIDLTGSDALPASEIAALLARVGR